jgi:hypothetical protein
MNRSKRLVIAYAIAKLIFYFNVIEANAQQKTIADLDAEQKALEAKIDTQKKQIEIDIKNVYDAKLRALFARLQRISMSQEGKKRWTRRARRDHDKVSRQITWLKISKRFFYARERRKRLKILYEKEKTELM